MNTNKCKKCLARKKDWEGDDPVCFLEYQQENDNAQENFFHKNWNCATLNELRDICYEGQELPYEVDYQYCDDQKYATIKINDIENVEGLALWVSWYKNRGETDAVYILDDTLPPRFPTEDELVKIIDYFNNKYG